MSTTTQTVRRAFPVSAGLLPPGSRVDRVLPAAALGALVAACWGYLLYTDWAMRNMADSGMVMPGSGPWTPADFSLVASMWLAMMIAMMIPSVIPALRVHRQVIHARSPLDRRETLTAAFLSGYVAMWVAFGAAMTLLQWKLHSTLIVDSTMTAQRWVGAMLLIVAGVYQWTPLKGACLAGCRSPLAFLVQNWRNGHRGALWMGVVHGAHCVGCCWLLMALMFVYGAMNLVWIVALTAVVLTEKLLAPNRGFARAVGAVLMLWGVAVLVLPAAG